jgi:putative phosphoribosyl transferase
MPARFRDRIEAGQRLAAELEQYADRSDVLVLALPRGGVPVAYEVARALGAPLDVFVVRKLGLPLHPELAMGAIASGGIRVLDREALRRFGVSEAALEAVTTSEERELERREVQYRGERPFPEVGGKTVLLVDDGLATGASMAAAAAALRTRGPARIVVAVPVAAADTCEAFRAVVDDVVCAVTPDPFHAVGLWYADFSQTSDEEVHDLLERATAELRERLTRNAGRSESRTVHIATGLAVLEGDLVVPGNARGVVLFAHGSGSSRHSPRNRQVARRLQREGLATLLVDLLTAEEERVDERTRHLRFDIGLLAGRLVGAIDWLGAQPETRDLAIGLFGASTGAGAALVAATERPDVVRAVVSRGGRPDLAGELLPLVRAPTLLVVGGSDDVVIRLNEEARSRMRAPVKLEIVPGATHLFEEPGAIEEVSRLAREWLVRHLTPRGRPAAAERSYADTRMREDRPRA